MARIAEGEKDQPLQEQYIEIGKKHIQVSTKPGAFGHLAQFFHKIGATFLFRFTKVCS